MYGSKSFSGMPFETALVHQANTTARFPISGVQWPFGTLASLSPCATAQPKDLRNSRISYGTLPQMILRCSCSWRSLSSANSGRKFRPQMRHSTMPFPLRMMTLSIRWVYRMDEISRSGLLGRDQFFPKGFAEEDFLKEVLLILRLGPLFRM